MKALEHEADAGAAHRGLFVGGQGGDIATFEAVVAAVGAVEQAEQIEQGGLAGARGAHHRHVLAGFDAQRHLAQRVDLAVAKREHAVDAFELDLCHVRPRRCARGWRLG